MENKLQDHKQELQRMQQSLSLDTEKLTVEAELEKKKKEASWWSILDVVSLL